MRHKGINKEETGKKIRAAAGRGFREHGYSGIGVDGLAKQAGVTSGAFYAHMGSKDGAFNVALTDGLDEVIENIPIFQQEYGASWIKEFADYYLGKTHRKDLACGCAMASLTSEVVRSGVESHAIYEKKMKRIAELIAEGMAGGSKSSRVKRAWSMLGILVGGINVARAMKTEVAAEQLAEAIREAVTRVAGDGKKRGD